MHSFPIFLFRFKAFVAIGDYNGHVGLGVKCSKEVSNLLGHSLVPDPIVLLNVLVKVPLGASVFSPLNRTFTAPHGNDSRIGEMD